MYKSFSDDVAREFATDSSGAICERCYDVACDVMNRDLGNRKLQQILAEHDRGAHKRWFHYVSK